MPTIRSFPLCTLEIFGPNSWFPMYQIECCKMKWSVTNCNECVVLHICNFVAHNYGLSPYHCHSYSWQSRLLHEWLRAQSHVRAELKERLYCCVLSQYSKAFYKSATLGFSRGRSSLCRNLFTTKAFDGCCPLFYLGLCWTTQKKTHSLWQIEYLI